MRLQNTHLSPFWQHEHAWTWNDPRLAFSCSSTPFEEELTYSQLAFATFNLHLPHSPDSLTLSDVFAAAVDSGLELGGKAGKNGGLKDHGLKERVFFLRFDVVGLTRFDYFVFVLLFFRLHSLGGESPWSLCQLPQIDVLIYLWLENYIFWGGKPFISSASPEFIDSGPAAKKLLFVPTANSRIFGIYSFSWGCRLGLPR